MAPGDISTVAGDGTGGFAGDGSIVDPDEDLIIADFTNNRIRRVDLGSGIITTVAGADRVARDAAGARRSDPEQRRWRLS